MPFSPRVILSLDRPLSPCSSAIQAVGGALREALGLPARQCLPVPDQQPCSNGAQGRDEGRSAEQHPVAGQAWIFVEDRATHPIDWQWCRERITCGRACRPPYCCAVLLSRFTRRSGSDSILACISHQPSAAADDAQRSAVFSHLGVLDVPSSTTPRPSGRKPRRAMHLADLATKAGEICRPGISSRTQATRCRYRPVHDRDTCLDVAPETEE